jgi:hypothetical protein
MKTVILSALMVLATSTAFAKDLNLVCLMGDIADLDIRIFSTGNGKATIEVKETAASGDEQILYNSNASNAEIQNAIQAGKISEVVSKSNLQDMFGGAYLHAGLLNMTLNPKTQAWDVLWSYSSDVMIAICSEK